MNAMRVCGSVPGRLGAGLLLLCGIQVPLQALGAGAVRGVSRPAGYVQLELPAGGLVLAGQPLHPFAADLEGQFGFQLEGGPGAEQADTVMFWDAEGERYLTLYRLEGGGDEALEGRWVYAGAEGPEPVSTGIEAGEGFWVRSRSGQDRRLFLTGEVALDEVFERDLEPGLHLLAHPYLETPLLSGLLPEEGVGAGDRLMLWEPLAGRYDLRIGVPGQTRGNPWYGAGEDQQRALRRLYPGEGFILERTGGKVFTWRSRRPYAAPFDLGEPTPHIESVDLVGTPGAIRLAIRTGRSGLVHILYQDPAPGGTFSPYAWREADRLDARSASALEYWTDEDCASRSPVQSTAVRLYLAVCGETDSDRDGLADGLEVFVHRTSPYFADTSGNGIPDGWLVRHGLDPLDPQVSSGSASGDGISNLDKFRRGLDPRVAYERGSHDAIRLQVASPFERHPLPTASSQK